VSKKRFNTAFPKEPVPPVINKFLLFIIDLYYLTSQFGIKYFEIKLDFSSTEG
jgi:hypothetical protein